MHLCPHTFAHMCLHCPSCMPAPVCAYACCCLYLVCLCPHCPHLCVPVPIHAHACPCLFLPVPTLVCLCLHLPLFICACSALTHLIWSGPAPVWVLCAHLYAHLCPHSHSPHSHSPVRSLTPSFVLACMLTCTLVCAHLCLVRLCLCALLHPLVPFSLYTISNLIIVELTYLSWLWSGSLLLQWLVTWNFVLVSVADTHQYP
jgi:hypothetical protein